MDRRRLLATAGALLGAGCSGVLPSGSTPTPTPSPTATATPGFRRAERPRYTPGSNPYAGEYDRAGGFELARGEYATLPVRATDAVALRYAFEVTDGPAIDVLLMAREAFDRFAGGGSRLSYYGDASSENRREARGEASLPAGEYVLVFDNTNRGPAKPDGPVRVRFGLSAVPRFRQATDPGFSPSSDPFSEEYARSGGLELDRGEYAPLSVGFEREFVLRYALRVRRGGPVDTFLVERAAFERYAAGNARFPFYAEASLEGSTDGSAEIRLPAGEYVLVFDNTHVGGAEPGGTVRLVYGLGFGGG